LKSGLQEVGIGYRGYVQVLSERAIIDFFAVDGCMYRFLVLDAKNSLKNSLKYILKSCVFWGGFWVVFFS
jgi:hypothetical protein